MDTVIYIIAATLLIRTYSSANWEIVNIIFLLSFVCIQFCSTSTTDKLSLMPYSLYLIALISFKTFIGFGESAYATSDCVYV